MNEFILWIASGGPSSDGLCPFMMRWTTPATGVAVCQNAVDVAERLESAFGYKRKSGRRRRTSASPPTADIRAPMSVSSRGPEVNFFSEFRESIIAHGRFVGLFLRGVAPAGAVMVGELGGRVSAWKRI